MYAIVSIAGFQEKVSEGMTLKVPTQDAEPRKTIMFDQVLLVGNGSDVTVGTPFVANASVEAEVLSHGRAKKVIIQKFERRKRYRRRKGHRQGYSEIKIVKIKA